jgi:hypothetical protein
MHGLRTLRDSWLGFWHGATRPSLTSLVIAFSLNSIAFVALCVYITPDSLGKLGFRYLMVDPFDRSVRITAKVLFQPSEPPDVVILGSSQTVFCIASEERLAGMVAEKVDNSAFVVSDMSMPAETPWVMAALAAQLHPQFNGVLVIGVTPGLLSIDNKRVRHAILGFSSEVRDNEARFAGLKVPYRTGIYLIDNRHFLLARQIYIIRNLFITGAPPDGDPMDEFWTQQANQPEFWRQTIRDFPRLVHQYELNKQANLAVIERLMARLKARGNISFILMESPINPLWYEQAGGKEFFEESHNDLHRFATKHGISFFSVDKAAVLSPSDFLDYEGHLGTREARERCTKAIASRLIEVLNKKNVASTISKAADSFWK